PPLPAQATTLRTGRWMSVQKAFALNFAARLAVETCAKRARQLGHNLLQSSQMTRKVSLTETIVARQIQNCHNLPQLQTSTLRLPTIGVAGPTSHLVAAQETR